MKRYIRLFKNVSNWGKHFAVKIGFNSDDPVIFNLRNSIKMEVPIRLYHEFKEIFLEDCYLQGLEYPMPGSPVIVDIGANAGFFCLYAASIRPRARIISCEPIRANFEQLSRNASINPGLDITTLPTAVYENTGTLKLMAESENEFTTAATVFSIDGRVPIEVPCISLQDLFVEHDLERVDLLKLDCEGSEYSILYRCPAEQLSKVRAMAVEVHKGPGPDHNLPSLSAFLEVRGFHTRSGGNMLWARRPAA